MKYLYSITIYLVFFLIIFQVESNAQEFTIAVIPDPQFYTDSYETEDCKNLGLYGETVYWIVDNKNLYNIKFVTHMGDITNNAPVTAQWEIAKNAHQLLQFNNIPFSVIPGNHDYEADNPFIPPYPAYDPCTRDLTNFRTYFGATHFNPPWYTDAHPGGIENTYNTFEVGDLKFLILNLEYAPRADIMDWAHSIIQSFPDRRVIVTTHCYQTRW